MAISAVSGASSATFATMANAARNPAAASATEAANGLRPESVEAENAGTGLDHAREGLEAAKRPKSHADAAPMAPAPPAETNPVMHMSAETKGPPTGRPADALGSLVDIRV